MKAKNLIVISGALIVLGIFVAFFYYSTPHEVPKQISNILKDSPAYRGKPIMIEGNPLVLYSFYTPYGSVHYYAVKDSTGQIPVSGDTQGLELIPADSKISAAKFTFVGQLGDVCVHGYYNQTSGKAVCDRTELGLLT